MKNENKVQQNSNINLLIEIFDLNAQPVIGPLQIRSHSVLISCRGSQLVTFLHTRVAHWFNVCYLSHIELTRRKTSELKEWRITSPQYNVKLNLHNYKQTNLHCLVQLLCLKSNSVQWSFVVLPLLLQNRRLLTYFLHKYTNSIYFQLQASWWELGLNVARTCTKTWTNKLKWTLDI